MQPSKFHVSRDHDNHDVHGDDHHHDIIIVSHDFHSPSPFSHAFTFPHLYHPPPCSFSISSSVDLSSSFLLTLPSLSSSIISILQPMLFNNTSFSASSCVYRTLFTHRRKVSDTFEMLKLVFHRIKRNISVDLQKFRKQTDENRCIS